MPDHLQTVLEGCLKENRTPSGKGEDQYGRLWVVLRHKSPEMGGKNAVSRQKKKKGPAGFTDIETRESTPAAMVTPKNGVGRLKQRKGKNGGAWRRLRVHKEGKASTPRHPGRKQAARKKESPA